MGKLLRVLVVLILLFSLGALVLGIMLFNKRELLKGRAQKLEDSLIALGATIEAAGPDEGIKSDYEARDISPVTSEMLDTPERSNFWNAYQTSLEQQGAARLELNARRKELTTYYARDALGKVLRDDRGYKMTSGNGTMQAVLDDLLARSQEQYGRLNATREQLKQLREETVDIIRELNTNKRARRQDLKKIEDLEAEVRRLSDEIVQQKQMIAELEEEKQRLEAEIGEQRRQIAFLEEEKAEKDVKIAELTKEIDRLKVTQTSRSGLVVARSELTLQNGTKGHIVNVNRKWNFAVIKMTDEFAAEVASQGGGVTGLELMVRRPGDEGQFVAKVRMISSRQAEKIGIADIDADWQQLPVEAGDIVFF